MSRLLGAEPWARQPQVPVGISCGNPLADRIVFAYNGATVFDHARRVRPTEYPFDTNSIGAPVVSGASGAKYGDFIGPFQQGDASDGWKINFQGFPLVGPSITLFARAYVDSNSGSGGFLFTFDDGVNDFGVEVGVGASTVEVWAADASTSWELTAGPSYGNGDIINIVVVVTSGQPLKVYTSLNESVYSSSSSFSNDNAAGSSMVVGAYNTNGNGCLLGVVACAMMWDRALSEREARAVMENPWQVFAPLRQVVLPLPASGAAAQFLSPVSDVSAGGWAPSSGSDLYAMLDESVASDADYIVSATASACTLAFAAGSDPAVSTGHILRYRLLAGSGSVTVVLKQGAATIASFGPHTLTGAAQDFAQTLTGGEADSITDYSALRVEFTSA